VPGVKLDGYLRVSSVRGREGDSFLSPELQRQQIERWASVHDHEIVRWATDLDQSGGKMDRPEFAVTMKRISSGKTQGVVVAKLDRFARSLPGALEAIKFLDEHDAMFVSVAEGVDPSTSAGKMMRNLLLVLAEFELDRIRDNWRAALTNAIEVRGIQPTVAPFGYRKDTSRRFVPDPTEAPYVREIFRRHLAGHTWASIARWLNDEIEPRQSREWTGETVKQLTRREVYTGVVSKGDLRKEDAHEALVSRPDFLAARGAFAKAGDAPSETRHPLNGIIRCAGCSRLMSGRRYKLPGQPRVPQYQCAVHSAAGTCPAPANINESVILPYVETAFFAYVGDISAESRPESVELTQALAGQAAAEGALTEFRDDVELQTEFGLEFYKAGLRTRQRAAQRASEALADGRRTANAVELPSVEHLGAMWPTLTASERQRLLAAAIDVIYVRRSGSGSHRGVVSRVKIVWHGDNTFVLSGPGRSTPLRTFDW
jgi:site-specific DNA recombinase